MLAKAGPSCEPIATPSIYLYMMSLKLNSTPDMALFIISMKTALENVQLCLSPLRDYSTFLPTVETINTLIFSGLSHFDAFATDESVTKSLWLR